jgi:hypothetical protein
MSARGGYSAAALAYFAAHAIDPAVAAEVGVTEAGEGIVYPYRDGDGTYERRRSLNGAGAKTLQPSGRPLACWWPGARSGEVVLVCEGESDALAALSAINDAGNLHPAAEALLRELVVVAVPGASFPAARLADELQGVARAILAPDGDEAGARFADRAADALRAAGITSARLPVADGDLSDYLAAAEDRADALAQAVADAEPDTEAPKPVDLLALETSPAETTGRSPIRFLDVAAMTAAPPPAVRWLASPMLPRASLTGLFAPGGDGKSLLAAAIAAALARGGEVAGIECETGTTIYLDGENGEWEIHRRVHTLGLPAEGVRMADASGFDLRQHLHLLAELVYSERPDLVVLDSLRSLTPGLDENDTKQTAAVLDPLRRLAHESGTAALLIHHTNKAGKDFRGASSIRDSCDALWHLGRHDDDQDRSRRFLACRKMRVAAEPERMWLRLEVDRGRVLIDPAEPPDEQLAQPVQPVRARLSDEILAGMNSSAMRLAEIAKAVGRQPKDGSVRNALAALLADGSLARDGTSYRKVQAVQTDEIAPLHLAPEGVQSANALKGIAPLHPVADAATTELIDRALARHGGGEQ